MRHLDAGRQADLAVLANTLGHLGFDEIGLADEVGDEAVGRSLVDFRRRSNLENVALRHDRDAVRHGEGFFLVVSHEDEGDAGLVLHALQLELHVLAELIIERRERFVEQQNLGFGRQSAGEGHALLLAAGDLAGLAVLQFFHAHEAQHGIDRRLHFALGFPEHFKAKGDVLRHRHMREQRIALEHRVDVPLEGREMRHFLTIEEDRPIGRHLKSGDEAQQSGLAAAGWSQQGEEFVLPDRDRHIVQGADFAGP